MRKAAFILSVLFLLLLGAAQTSFAFRCGTRLIEIGDTKYEVLSRCGEPNWRDSWEEDRIERVYSWGYPRLNGNLNGRVPLAAVVRVVIEEWTYNLGPTQFMRILRFENSRLVDIATGDYGFN